MCLAIPMKVAKVDGQSALVEQAGMLKEVRIDLLGDVEAGEYVLVHAGIAIERVRPAEAEETLRVMRMIADAVR